MIAELEHKEVCIDLQAGVECVMSCLSLLRALSPRLFGWDLMRFQHRPLISGDRVAVEQLLAPDPTPRPDARSRYWLPIYSSAGKGSPDAHIELLVGPADGGEPAVRLSTSLVAPLSSAALEDWCRRVGELPASFCTVGPAKLIRESGVGWLTFVRDIDPQRLDDLDPCMVEQGRRFALVRAHPGAPDADTEEVRRACRRVAGRLGRMDRSALEDSSDTPEPALKLPPPPTGPDVTLPLRTDEPVPRDIPFARGAPSAVWLDVLLREASDARATEQTTVNETALMPGAPVLAPPRGNFTDALGALVLPELSLEQYAELRAELIGNGEDDSATLRRFGVVSAAAHNALRVRFAELFKQDAPARERFVADVQRRVDARRRSE